MKNPTDRTLILRTAGAFIVLIALWSCGSPLSLLELVDGPTGAGLSVSPATGVVTANSNVTLSTDGGYPPYSYQVVSGFGTLSGNIYTAPASTGEEIVRVSDSAGNSIDAVFQIDGGGIGLGLSPSTSTVYTGESVSFVPIGGSGSYSVAITTNNSGAGLVGYAYTAGSEARTDTITLTDTVDLSTVTATVTVNERALAMNATSVSLTTTSPLNTFDFNPVGGTGPFSFAISPSLGTINTSTGAYTAVSAGTETIELTDAYDGRTVTATVTVTAGTFVPNVDYDADPITNVVSASEKTGGAFTADGTIHNNGTSAGAGDLNWFVYASPDQTVGGTSDYLLDSGVIPGGLAAGANTTVAISGQWPDVQGDYYLLLSVAAAGSVPDAGNVSSTPGTTYITRPVAISPSAFTVYPDQDIQFTATGEGSGFTWDFDGGSASGATITAGGLYTAGGTPATDTVRVTDTHDGSTALATITVVATPLPNAVDYQIDSIVPSVTTTETGDAFGGNLNLSNATTGTGSQVIEWDLYASTDTVLGIGDRLLAEGTTPALGPSGAVTVPFTGSWPSEPGSYYLIARINAADESNTAGNVLPSGSSIAITAPPDADVQYSVTSFPTGGAVTPNTGLVESLIITNTGSAGGTQNVTWSAYLSDNTVYDSGVDTLIGSGTLAGGLAAGANSGSLALSGTWPLETDPWPNYIIIRMSAPEDVDKTDNQVVSPAFQKLVTGDDYIVTEITAAYVDVLGGSAVRETFTVTNVGDAGGPAFDWNMYVSADATLDGGDTLVGGSSAAAIGSSSSVTFSGIPAFWPTVSSATPYYLIVDLVGDSDITNNTAVSGPYTVNPPPDYRFTSVNTNNAESSTGSLIGATGTFNFVIGNDGGDGAVSASWRVFASTDPALDATDTELLSGAIPALNGGTTIPSPIDLGAASWPAFGSYYYLIYTVSADDDTNSFNDTHVEGPFRVPSVFVESEPNDWDYVDNPGLPRNDVGTAIGAELNVGELLRIDGVGDLDNNPLGNGEDGYDSFTFVTGPGVSEVEFVAFWTVGLDSIDLYVSLDGAVPEQSLDLADFREPTAGQFVVSGWSAGSTGDLTVYNLNGTTGLEPAYSVYVYGR